MRFVVPFFFSTHALSETAAGFAGASQIRNPSTKPSQLHTNAVLEFEERLEAIRTGLSQGVDCHVWEGE